MPPLIPVIDLRAGEVVHAVAGRRSEYQPLKSVLTTSTRPLEVMLRLQEATGLETFYIADLDGILDGRPNFRVLERLVAAGPRLLIDAGARTCNDLKTLRMGPNVLPILPTESFEQFDQMLVDGVPDVVCSLDLAAGKLQLADKRLKATLAGIEQLAERLWNSRIRRWIVLDIAAVGTGQGITTLELCRNLLDRFPGLELISGGGVKSTDCVAASAAAGLSGLLVASALHDGRLLPLVKSLSCK